MGDHFASRDVNRLFVDHVGRSIEILDPFSRAGRVRALSIIGHVQGLICEEYLPCVALVSLIKIGNRIDGITQLGRRDIPLTSNRLGCFHINEFTNNIGGSKRAA